MSIQQNITNIAKLGYQVTIDVDHHGYVIAGVFHQPDKSGMSASVLDPTNETGNDLDEVLTELVKRLNKTIREQGNERSIIG